MILRSQLIYAHDPVPINIILSLVSRRDHAIVCSMNMALAEYKIILLGQCGVGKTSYFFQLRDGIFLGSSVSTVSQGVEYMTFKTMVNGEEVKVRHPR